MAQFSFKAIARSGEVETGSLDAQNKEMASRQLRSRGLTLLSLESGTGLNAQVAISSKGAPPGRNEILAVTNELAVLLRAGMPLDKSLNILIDMAVKPQMKNMLEELLASVKGGKGLSQALEPYQNLFGSFYINMIRSGEASGHLLGVLESLGTYLQSAKETREGVVAALIYPCILLVVTMISIVAMLGLVVPQFESLFADMGDALPGITQLVLSAANGIKAYGLYLVVILLITGFLLRNWLKTKAGKSWLGSTLLKTPLLGNIVFEFEVSKFARTLGTLLGNGVPMLKSINIGIETVDNQVIKDALSVLPAAVKSGKRIALALEETGMFTPMVIQMTRVGEESGSLDKMMLELTRVFDGNVKAGVKKALTLMEPLLILFMGIVIGTIMVAIMSGIFSVSELAL